jgi:hypothetical protein
MVPVALFGLLFVVSADPLWQQGHETVVIVNSDWTWSLSFAGVTWLGAAPNAAKTTSRTSAGADWMGEYDELALGPSDCPSTVRFYSRIDAFVFGRCYDQLARNASAFEPYWPSMAPPNSSERLNALAWSPSYMLKGARLQPWMSNGGLNKFNDGPIFVFDENMSSPSKVPPPLLPTLAFSALDHFDSNTINLLETNSAYKHLTIGASTAGPYPMGPTPGSATAKSIPRRTMMRALLLTRPGLKRATVAWGVIMRRFHNTTRYVIAMRYRHTLYLTHMSLLNQKISRVGASTAFVLGGQRGRILLLEYRTSISKDWLDAVGTAGDALRHVEGGVQTSSSAGEAVGAGPSRDAWDGQGGCLD